MKNPDNDFENSWGNQTRAESYAKLEFPNIYYLAYRDLPKIIFWTVQDYYKLFGLAKLEVEAAYKPLGYETEPFKWISETRIAPWMIFVLKKTNS